MLRERRRAANNKPNRRLDRKSSRGMIYENEELRLRTININAEVERGQSDIRKLRRENDQLRREIWSLRDEYDRLDKLLRGHNSKKSINYQQELNDENDDDDDDDDDCDTFSENSDTCEICKEEENRDQTEIAENVENVQKVNSGKFKNKKLHVNFDHLSIVSEENDNFIGIELEDEPISPLRELQSVLPPLAHFENLPYELIGPNIDEFGQIHKNHKEESIKTPKHFFSPIKSRIKETSGIFQTGGNLEDLLQEIEKTKSLQDLSINEQKKSADLLAVEVSTLNSNYFNKKPFRSEINLVLTSPDGHHHENIDTQVTPPVQIPEPMILLPSNLPYIGFDNLTNQGPPYDSLNINHQILDDLTKQLSSIAATTTPDQLLFSRNSSPVMNESTPPPPPPLQPPSKHSNENLEILKRFGGKPLADTDSEQKKTRRVSIFLNKKNDKEKRRASIDVSTIISSSNPGQNHRRHSSVHHHRKLSHDSIKIRSVSNCGGRKNSRHSTSIEGGTSGNDKPSTSATSSRESSDSSRKMSINSHAGNNKIPWCGCWGNGCF